MSLFICSMIQSRISSGHGTDRPVAAECTNSQIRRVVVSVFAAGTSAPVRSQCETTVSQPSAMPWPSSRRLHHDGIVGKAQRLGRAVSLGQKRLVLRRPVRGRVDQADDGVRLEPAFGAVRVAIGRAADRQHDLLHDQRAMRRRDRRDRETACRDRHSRPAPRNEPEINWNRRSTLGNCRCSLSIRGISQCVVNADDTDSVMVSATLAAAFDLDRGRSRCCEIRRAPAGRAVRPPRSAPRGRRCGRTGGRRDIPRTVRSMRLTAGWLTFSSAAAAVKLPLRAAASKTNSALLEGSIRRSSGIT